MESDRGEGRSGGVESDRGEGGSGGPEMVDSVSKQRGLNLY